MGKQHFRNSAASILAIATMQFAAPRDAGAQQPPAEPATSNSSQLEEIVVTVRKKEETLQKVPVAAFALTKIDLEQHGIDNVISLAKLTPGLLIDKAVNGTGATIFLRGVGTAALNVGFDQAVSVNIDNVPISKGRAIFDSYLDMQQVEVLEGPQALFFGKNSTAGIISVSTANPRDYFEAKGQFGYKLYGDGPYGEAMVSGPINDKLALRVALRATGLNGGYFTNISGAATGVYHDRDVPQETDLAGRMTLVFKPSDDFDLNLKVTPDKEDSDGANNYAQVGDCQGPGGKPQPIFGAFPQVNDGCRLDHKQGWSSLDPAIAAHYPQSNGGQPFLRYDSVLTALTANYHLDDLTFTSVTGFYHFDAAHFENYVGGAPVVFGDEHAIYNSVTEEFRVHTSFDYPVNVTAGVFYDSTQLQFSRTTRLLPSLPDPGTGYTYDWGQVGETDGETKSAFFDVAWNILPELELAAGARFSDETKPSVIQNTFVNANFSLASLFSKMPIHDRFHGDNLSPAATLTWRPESNLTFFAAYRTGYKSGGSNLGAVISTTTTPDLIHYNAEKVTGEEIGAKMTFLDNTLRLNATLYDYIYNDLQVEIFNPAAIAENTGNAGELETRGFEAELLYNPVQIEGLTLHSSLAYNRAAYNQYISDCYTGQTIAEGCNLHNSAGGVAQNLAGKIRAQAPVWTTLIGASYDFPAFGGALKIGINADGRYTSKYYTNETLQPNQVTPGYWNINAGLRVYDPHNTWEIALIGSNLADEIKGISSVDLTGTGGGTGTKVGQRSDGYFLGVTAPREVELQFTYRY